MIQQEKKAKHLTSAPRSPGEKISHRAIYQQISLHYLYRRSVVRNGDYFTIAISSHCSFTLAGQSVTMDNHRSTDVGSEPCICFFPIEEFQREPLRSLEGATKALERMVPRVETGFDAVKEQARSPSDRLMSDESAAIALHTMG